MYLARSVRYVAQGRAIVNDVSLRLVPGKVVAIVGPNGAGKSTLLKLVAGELRPSAGEILLDERSLSDWPIASLARRRSVLPQAAEVVFPFLVSEVVALGVSQGLTARQADALARDALAAVELEEFAARLYGSLSGGEKQRVQLARVLAQLWASASGEGGYLLLDEPTTSLDIAHQLLTLRLAHAHARAGGGVMMILHDINLACMAADEIVALKDGCRVAAGAPRDIVTSDLIAALYGVRAEIRGVPDGPFLLPQTARPPHRAVATTPRPD